MPNDVWSDWRQTSLASCLSDQITICRGSRLNLFLAPSFCDWLAQTHFKSKCKQCLSLLPFPTFPFCECACIDVQTPTLRVLWWPRLSCYFFAFLQVVVFEEQETDGKIQFTSTPDYGMSVDVQWGQEVRGECGWGEEDDGRGAGENMTEAFVSWSLNSLPQPTATLSVNMTFCVQSEDSGVIKTSFFNLKTIYYILFYISSN